MEYYINMDELLRYILIGLFSIGFVVLITVILIVMSYSSIIEGHSDANIDLWKRKND
jgi:hypothetical protein